MCLMASERHSCVCRVHLASNHVTDQISNVQEKTTCGLSLAYALQNPVHVQTGCVHAITAALNVMYVSSVPAVVSCAQMSAGAEMDFQGGNTQFSI